MNWKKPLGNLDAHPSKMIKLISPKSIVGICGKYLTLYKLYSMYFWAEQTLMPTLVAMLLGVTG
jgi:hypothetical protein